MSDERDIFARRDYHGELIPARFKKILLDQMSAHLLQAANVVIGNMPPSDERYPYALGHLVTMMGYVDAQTLAHQMGMRDVDPPHRITYREVGGHADNELRQTYGSENPILSTAANSRPGYDPEVANRAEAGREAVESVVVGIILDELPPTVLSVNMAG